MDILPIGYTVHTCDQQGDGAGLLKGGDADNNTNAHVHDLFHEDAQVRLEYFPDRVMEVGGGGAGSSLR